MPEQGGVSPTIVLSILAFIFTVSNAVFIFLWNNMKNDNKELKEDLTGKHDEFKKDITRDLDGLSTTLRDKMKELWDALDKKASDTDMADRRGDIKELYTMIGAAKTEMLEKIEAVTDRIMGEIDRCHPTRKRRVRS